MTRIDLKGMTSPIFAVLPLR